MTNRTRWMLLAYATALWSAVATAGTAPKLTPELQKKGGAAFATNCATCHGDQGEGNGPAAEYMDTKPRNLQTQPFKKGDSLQQIFATITQGLSGTGMPESPTWIPISRWGSTTASMPRRS